MEFNMVKCVIWDLDDTIWEGTLSENKEVYCKENILQVVNELRNMGIVQSICSKNDFNTAKNKLREFGIDDFFLLPQISWHNKSEGINEIIEGFHLRQEDIVFIDNSKFERDEVHSVFPLILSLDVKDIDQLLAHVKENFSVDAMGIERVHLYENEEKRIIAQRNYDGNNISFLKSCEMKLAINRASADDTIRMIELIDRTHQINTSGVFYDHETLNSIVNDNLYEVYVATVEDKYGSYGKSGIAIVNKTGGRYIIEILIVSCRLLGKGISQAMLSYLQLQSYKSNSSYLYCILKETTQNKKMRLLFLMNKFEIIENEENAYLYGLKNDKSNTIQFPEWIELM